MATAGRKRGSDKAGAVRPQTLTPESVGIAAVAPPEVEQSSDVNVANAEELAEPRVSVKVDRAAAATEMARAYRPHPDADLVKNYPKKKG
jgi:hypothetical protein